MSLRVSWVAGEARSMGVRQAKQSTKEKKGEKTMGTGRWRESKSRYKPGTERWDHGRGRGQGWRGYGSESTTTRLSASYDTVAAESNRNRESKREGKRSAAAAGKRIQRWGNSEHQHMGRHDERAPVFVRCFPQKKLFSARVSCIDL